MAQRPRYDSNRVKLRTGEYQKADGHYEYRYTVFGKKYSVYAKNLETLREKESEILSLKTANQAKSDSRTTTLNELFSLWKELKRGLRPNTFQNYCYMYEQYVQDGLGRLYIASIRKSDSSFDVESEVRVFNRTFALLNKRFGSDSFKRYNHEKDAFEGATTISAFEAMTPSISKNIEYYEALPESDFRAKVIEMHNHPYYTQAAARRSTDRFKALISIGEEIFNVDQNT